MTQRRHSLDVWIGLFWILTGALSIQLSWFVISIALESRELWHMVLEATNKDPTVNLMMAFALMMVGFFQIIFGLIMITTRDKNIDKHSSHKKPNDSEYAPTDGN